MQFRSDVLRKQAMREEYDKLAGAGAAARYEMEREMERVDLEQEVRIGKFRLESSAKECIV